MPATPPHPEQPDDPGLLARLMTALLMAALMFGLIVGAVAAFMFWLGHVVLH